MEEPGPPARPQLPQRLIVVPDPPHANRPLPPTPKCGEPAGQTPQQQRSLQNNFKPSVRIRCRKGVRSVQFVIWKEELIILPRNSIEKLLSVIVDKGKTVIVQLYNKKVLHDIQFAIKLQKKNLIKLLEISIFILLKMVPTFNIPLVNLPNRLLLDPPKLLTVAIFNLNIPICKHHV